MEVRFAPGAKPQRLRARLAGATVDEVTLLVFEQGNIRERKVRLAEAEAPQPVASLRMESKPEKVARGVGIGVGVALGAAGILVVVAFVAFGVGSSRNA